MRSVSQIRILLKDRGEGQITVDTEGNIEKVLALYYQLQTPPHQRKTVSALLEYEKTMGIHRPHGTLKDPSAAAGILWIGRSLLFQNISPLEPAMDPKHATHDGGLKIRIATLSWVGSSATTLHTITTDFSAKQK
jgi:hypothetical protein